MLSGLLWIGVLSTSNCAGVRQTALSEATGGEPRPRPAAIMVEVRTDPAIAPAERADAGRAARALEASLLVALRRTGLSVAASRDGDPPPGDGSGALLLRCTVLRVREGNEYLRLGVGFGAGQNSLKVGSELFDASVPPAARIASWTTRATTGSMPGAAFGAVPVVAGASAAGLIAPAVGVAAGLGQDSRWAVAQVTRSIETQSEAILAEHGWAPVAPALPLAYARG